MLNFEQVSQETREKIERLLKDNDPLQLWDTIQGHLKRFAVLQRTLLKAVDLGVGRGECPENVGAPGPGSLRSPSPATPTSFGAPTFSEPRAADKAG